MHTKTSEDRTKRKPSEYLQHHLDGVGERFEVDPPRWTLMSEASGLILESKSVPRPLAGSRPSRSSSTLYVRSDGSTLDSVFPGVARDTPRGLAPLRYRFASRACSAAPVTQERRRQPLVIAPKRVPHTNTDARRSSSATHRVHYEDCGERVHECPQSQWEQQQTRDGLLPGDAPRTSRVAVNMSHEQRSAKHKNVLRRFDCSCGNTSTRHENFTRSQQLWKTVWTSFGKRRRLKEHLRPQRSWHRQLPTDIKSATARSTQRLFQQQP